MSEFCCGGDARCVGIGCECHALRAEVEALRKQVRFIKYVMLTVGPELYPADALVRYVADGSTPSGVDGWRFLVGGLHPTFEAALQGCMDLWSGWEEDMLKYEAVMNHGQTDQN